jgi:antitoxin VapB
VEQTGLHYGKFIERKIMLQLAPQTEQLARRVAARLGRKPDDLIRDVIENQAKALGVRNEPRARKRMTAVEMLALGREIAAMPVLDPRSPQQIADDLNET